MIIKFLYMINMMKLQEKSQLADFLMEKGGNIKGKLNFQV